MDAASFLEGFFLASIGATVTYLPTTMAKPKPPKLRLDALLVARGLFESAAEAQAHILAGEVWAGQTRLDKAGALVAADLVLEVRGTSLKFVSRAGYKLEHALDTFGISVEGRTCVDVGSSTGGFTDCLLQRGAAHVFAIDVGTGQLHPRMRSDARVTVMERFNARELRAEQLRSSDAKTSAAEVSFVCADVSFISLEKIIPAVQLAVPAETTWLLLFKPQFQVDRADLGNGGVVRTAGATERALSAFEGFMAERGLFLQDLPRESPLAGKKSGNVEILLYFGKDRKK